MTIASRGISALGKLAFLVVLLFVFSAGMAGVVYVSLSGRELTVPEIVGKDFVESEKELAALGLKIKRRADRVSAEKINTVLEQLPKAGETVKTGQLILVVVSKAGLEGEEVPATLKKLDDDDTEKIEEMISDKPRKPKANTNASKKKADTTRDVIATDGNSNSAGKIQSPAGDKSDGSSGQSNTRSPASGQGAKPVKSPAGDKPLPARPGPGDAKPRTPVKP